MLVRGGVIRTSLPTLVLAGMLLVSACGPRTEYRVADLSIQRHGWDSLRVDVAFASETAIGGRKPVEPDRVEVILYDQDYVSLYSGQPGVVPVPDQQLGSRERLTIEACGSVRGRQVCVQDVLRASRKRLEVDPEVEFPLDEEMTSGRYEFTFRAQRLASESEDWQPISPADVKGFLRVWVENSEVRERGAIDVPFERTSGSFDLSRSSDYRDFSFYLESQLLDRDTAFVHFDIYAGLGGAPERLTSVRQEVYWKSEDEREEDVRYFARIAAERIVDELGSFLGGRNAIAYVDDWDFDSRRRQYRLQLEIRWEGSFFDRGRFALEGMLAVSGDGRDATFERTDANRRAERRWRSRVGEDILPLGDLGSPGRMQTPDGSSRNDQRD